MKLIKNLIKRVFCSMNLNHICNLNFKASLITHNIERTQSNCYILY